MYNRLGSHLSSREAEGKKPDESGKEAGNENELSSTKDEKTVSNTAENAEAAGILEGKEEAKETAEEGESEEREEGSGEGRYFQYA